MISRNLKVLLLPVLLFLVGCNTAQSEEPIARAEAENLAFHLESAFTAGNQIELFRSDTLDRAFGLAETALMLFPFSDLEFEPTTVEKFEKVGLDIPVFTLFNDSVTWCLLPRLNFPDGAEMTTVNSVIVEYEPFLGACDSGEVSSEIDARVGETHLIQERMFGEEINGLAGEAIALARNEIPAAKEIVVYAENGLLVLEYPDLDNDLGFSTLTKDLYQELPDTLQQMGVGYLRDSQSYTCLQFKFYDRYIHLNNDLAYWDDTYIKDECGTLAY